MELDLAPWDMDWDDPVDTQASAPLEPSADIVEPRADPVEHAQQAVEEGSAHAHLDTTASGLEDLATSDHAWTRALEEREIALADYVVESIPRTLGEDGETGRSWHLEVFVYMEVRRPCSQCRPE